MHPTVQCTHVHKILVKYTLTHIIFLNTANRSSGVALLVQLPAFSGKRLIKDEGGRCQFYIQYIYILCVWLCSMMHTAKSDSAVWCTQQKPTPQWNAHRGVFFYNSNVLAKSKEFENTLACLSVVQMGSNREKLEVNHRIKDDRMENCVAYIGFISK